MLIFFNLLNLFWHTDKIFCYYAEVTFWDFVRNDNSNKGTTARLNGMRLDSPLNKSRPQYISAQNISSCLPLSQSGWFYRKLLVVLQIQYGAVHENFPIYGKMLFAGNIF